MKCTLRVAKTKALISFAVTVKLICVFVFAYTIVGFLTWRLIIVSKLKYLTLPTEIGIGTSEYTPSSFLPQNALKFNLYRSFYLFYLVLTGDLFILDLIFNTFL